MRVSAEGLIEHKKRHQTTTSQWPVGIVFGVQFGKDGVGYRCCMMSVWCQIEYQKRNQTHPLSGQVGFSFLCLLDSRPRK